MVIHDVSDNPPGRLLVARLHVDLCRLASALGHHRRGAGSCRRPRPAARV